MSYLQSLAFIYSSQPFEAEKQELPERRLISANDFEIRDDYGRFEWRRDAGNFVLDPEGNVVAFDFVGAASETPVYRQDALTFFPGSRKYGKDRKALYFRGTLPFAKVKEMSYKELKRFVEAHKCLPKPKLKAKVDPYEAEAKRLILALMKGEFWLEASESKAFFDHLIKKGVWNGQRYAGYFKFELTPEEWRKFGWKGSMGRREVGPTIARMFAVGDMRNPHRVYLMQ